MKDKLSKIFDKISNPLLFYVDNDEHSVFRNFCLFSNDGNMYDKNISVHQAKPALIYRTELNKRLNVYTFLMTFIIYLLFIHTLYSIQGLILYEILWVILFFAGRMLCSELYKRKLISLYGNYRVVDFEPAIGKDKRRDFRSNYISKVVALILCIVLVIIPAILLQKLIKINLNKKVPNYNAALTISNIYTLIYPQNTFILETKALSDYVDGNFEQASGNYIKAINLSGKYFNPKYDYVKFANLLYLLKKSEGSQQAIDKFNELSTEKNLTTDEQIKLLWIKSNFSIVNDCSESVISDYDDLLMLVGKSDAKSSFYILSDKAYMLYLLENYEQAMAVYNSLIDYATKHLKNFGKELPRLYAERGFTRRHLKQRIEADGDFIKSNIDLYSLKKYEPRKVEQGLIIERF